ncbi:MAG: alpha/beta hydrolase [Polyangiaceae bacterium]|nr:alpha/beta hydrolase [Polyangiaceae bacterium]
MVQVRERIERVRANGIELAVHRFEADSADADTPPAKQTLLLLHGFLDAAATWDLVAAPLARAGYEVLAPDFRGFGESDRVPEGGYYHFADYVADMDDLVRALAPRSLSIVAHSMGGGVATLFAGARPERVEKLVVMEGLGPISDPPAYSVDRMRRWLADRQKISRTPRLISSMDEALERLAATHPRIDRDVLRTRAEKLVRRGADGTISWAWDPLHRTTSPTPFQTEVYGSFLRAITCPTLFVSGGPTGWHPPDEAERLALFQKLDRVELPDAGHMMHWTAPDAVAGAILSFLASA